MFYFYCQQSTYFEKLLCYQTLFKKRLSVKLSVGFWTWWYENNLYLSKSRKVIPKKPKHKLNNLF